MPESSDRLFKPASHDVVDLNRLSFSGTYTCPICRHGQISALALMDAFACSFCRHIFTANLQNQSIHVVDSSQPMAWYWNGRRWQTAHREDFNLTLVIWLVGAGFILVPTALVWLSSYTFPPLPGSRWEWFPQVWLGCTFTVHFLLVAWLLVEHYQFPLYVTAKIRLRSLLERLQTGDRT